MALEGTTVKSSGFYHLQDQKRMEAITNRQEKRDIDKDRWNGHIRGSVLE